MHQVLYQLPSIQGWALYAWSEQNNGAVEMYLVSAGYLKQQTQRHSLTRPTRLTRRTLNPQPSTLNP